MPGAQPQVLVVEDNLLIAMEVAALVEDCRCIVIGPFNDVGSAMPAAREITLAAAILDINLGDERVWPIADELAERDIPFALATGYAKADIPARFLDKPILTKPVSAERVRRCLQHLGLVLP